jgi:diaminopimelate epimerase
MRFHKMHGLGNDFVIVDGRDQSVTITPDLARAIADRHRGVGCDQLILVGKSDTADVSMRIWNHDGGEVESCGNAARCVVALTGATTIETPAGVIEGSAGRRGRGHGPRAALRLGRHPALLCDGHDFASRSTGAS